MFSSVSAADRQLQQIGNIRQLALLQNRDALGVRPPAQVLITSLHMSVRNLTTLVCHGKLRDAAREALDSLRTPFQLQAECGRTASRISFTVVYLVTLPRELKACMFVVLILPIRT